MPFQYCYSLIANREFNLHNGFVAVDCKNWKKLLVSVYEIFLKALIKEMKSNKFVENTLSDIRIKQIMRMITESGCNKVGGFQNQNVFDIKRIQEESKLFPLCMRSLYLSLVKTNRLAHNER